MDDCITIYHFAGLLYLAKCSQATFILLVDILIIFKREIKLKGTLDSLNLKNTAKNYKYTPIVRNNS